jgi:hypothetical protein
MRKSTVVRLCTFAIALCVASSFIVDLGADDSDTAASFFTLVHAVPVQLAHWLWPKSAPPAFALAALVFVWQYLVLLVLAVVGWQLLRVSIDFLGPPKHRGSLTGRRA